MATIGIFLSSFVLVLLVNPWQVFSIIIYETSNVIL